MKKNYNDKQHLISEYKKELNKDRGLLFPQFYSDTYIPQYFKRTTSKGSKHDIQDELPQYGRKTVVTDISLSNKGSLIIKTEDTLQNQGVDISNCFNTWVNLSDGSLNITFPSIWDNNLSVNYDSSSNSLVFIVNKDIKDTLG